VVVSHLGGCMPRTKKPAPPKATELVGLSKGALTKLAAAIVWREAGGPASSQVTREGLERDAKKALERGGPSVGDERYRRLQLAVMHVYALLAWARQAVCWLWRHSVVAPHELAWSVRSVKMHVSALEELLPRVAETMQPVVEQTAEAIQELQRRLLHRGSGDGGGGSAGGAAVAAVAHARKSAAAGA